MPYLSAQLIGFRFPINENHVQSPSRCRPDDSGTNTFTPYHGIVTYHPDLCNLLAELVVYLYAGTLWSVPMYDNRDLQLLENSANQPSFFLIVTARIRHIIE